jgi:hypothetical protein
MMKMSATQFAYLRWLELGKPPHARSWYPQTVEACRHAGWAKDEELTAGGRWALEREKERRNHG